MDDSAEERARRANARVGTVLRGKWRIDALVGVGGMATVYAATHRNARRVAIKVLHPECSVHEADRARFVREGYAANLIGHPGAVAVLDDDVTEDGAAFLVMELLEGETLEARWQALGGALDAGEVLSLIDPVLDVLAAAHDKGIVHRDLKPENLFLTADGRVKVLDFGLARLRELSSDPRTRTINGVIMGTPAFMPPEQARGRLDDIDARTDIWAIGATMFTLLSGRLVHESDTLQGTIVACITEPAPPLESVAPGVPLAIAAVVNRALEKDRDRRFQTAREMQEAIRSAYAELFAATLPVSVPAPPMPASERALAPAPSAPSSSGAVDAAARASSVKQEPTISPARSAVPFHRAPFVRGLVLALAAAAAVALVAFMALQSDRGNGAAAPPAVTPGAGPTALATGDPTIPTALPIPPADSASAAAPAAPASAAPEITPSGTGAPASPRPTPSAAERPPSSKGRPPAAGSAPPPEPEDPMDRRH